MYGQIDMVVCRSVQVLPVGALAHAMLHACCAAPVFEAQPRKQVPHWGAVPIIPITTDTTSFAEATAMTCSIVHGASAPQAW